MKTIKIKNTFFDNSGKRYILNSFGFTPCETYNNEILISNHKEEIKKYEEEIQKISNKLYYLDNLILDDDITNIDSITLKMIYDICPKKHFIQRCLKLEKDVLKQGIEIEFLKRTLKEIKKNGFKRNI